MATYDESLRALAEMCVLWTCGHAERAWGNASYHVIVDDFLKALSTLLKTFLK